MRDRLRRFGFGASGLMIGAEVEEGRRLFPGEEPHVAGAEALVTRYLKACEALDVPARAATTSIDARSNPISRNTFFAA